MIRHIVLFTLKEDLDPQDRDYILGQVGKLGEISGVQNLNVGMLLDPKHEGYKSRMWSDFKNALLMDFDDEDGLDAYQTDPFHVVVARELRERVSAIKVVDFVTS